jgi:hypothetical protein
MTANDQQRRFSLDDRGYVTDKANPGDDRKYKYHGEPDPSDKDVRGYLLWRRLNDLVPKLIVESKTELVGRSLVYMLRAVIEASQLNILDPSLAIDHPFKGKLRKKNGIGDYTSISLFIRDVERLLRKLYGDLDSKALEELLEAIRLIVDEFAVYVNPDLRLECSCADDYDYGNGIGVPEGYCVSSSQHRDAWEAERALAIRAMQVSTNPGAYGRYTKRFVRALKKYWLDLGGWDRSRKDLRSKADKKKVHFD